VSGHAQTFGLRQARGRCPPCDTPHPRRLRAASGACLTAHGAHSSQRHSRSKHDMCVRVARALIAAGRPKRWSGMGVIQSSSPSRRSSGTDDQLGVDEDLGRRIRESLWAARVARRRGRRRSKQSGALHEQELAPGHAAQAQQTLLPFCERWQLLSAPSATAPRRSEMVATHSRLI
jgi:hypothetical protein